MNIDQLMGQSLRARLEAIRQTPEAKKQLHRLDKATRDVEAVFMKLLIGEMRKTGMQGMLGHGMEAQMYSDFLDGAVAGEIAGKGGVGIGKLLYDRMSNALLRQMAAKQSGETIPSNQEDSE
jgi:Rod binding domain-containing protein